MLGASERSSPAGCCTIEALLAARAAPYFLDEVARSGSIRKAAEQLNIASSAVNHRILALERELGVPVFERLHKQLRLTAAGEILIAHIRGTISEHPRALSTTGAMKGLRAAPFRS